MSLQGMGLEDYKRQIQVLTSRSQITLKCDKCGNTLTLDNFTLGRLELAEQAYFNHTWRVQNGEMLCGYCTDNKR